MCAVLGETDAETPLDPFAQFFPEKIVVLRLRVHAWGPCWVPSRIDLQDHGVPVVTGNPSSVYLRSNVAAGCVDNSGAWKVWVCLERMKEFIEVEVRMSYRAFEAS